MMRFEKTEGNKIRFWEIEHDDDLVITRSGTVGRPPKTREKEFPDLARAEDDLNAQIQAKRRQGWVEVTEASEPPSAFEERKLTLHPLDGSAPETFTGKDVAYLVTRMVDVEVFDRYLEAPDLSRWEYRAQRRCRLDAVPAPGDDAYDAWRAEFLDLSKRDRQAPMQGDCIGAFKFNEGSNWIVGPDEAEFLAREGDRRVKRRKDSAAQAKLIARWVSFNGRTQSVGYEIRASD